jgi:hypothetical protein
VHCVDDAGALWRVPVEWTDLAALDAEYVLSAGCAYLLLDDLLSLAELVARAKRW